MTLDTPIDHLPMVGPTFARRLKNLGIVTINDLLNHYPHRYNDLSLISPITNLKPGETATIKGEIISMRNIYTRRGRPVQKAVIADKTASIEATWFNQPFLTKTLKPGSLVALAGKVEALGAQKTFISPEYEIIRPATIHTGRLVPIYPETSGISSKWLRSRIFPLLNTIFLPHIDDYLPKSIRLNHHLIDLTSALRSIHFPQNPAEADTAKQRLEFDELFLLQIQALKTRIDWHQAQLAHPFTVNQDKILRFISRFPFQLTSSQNQAVTQILSDLRKPQAMNRLLQGDVGSGKTIVAAIAIYVAYLNGYQSIFMAPTEILANQHYQTLEGLFQPIGIDISLLTASTPKSKNWKLKIANSKIVIGTHALLYRQLDLPKLGLVVIDEQHRFGVSQRTTLLHHPHIPHLLTMTATPIPRTIALTLYADLDLSILEEMPAGRQLIKTWVVPPQKRVKAYHWIRDQIHTHHTQAFIICPFIDESDIDSLKNIRAATKEYDHLTKEVFPDLNLALIHGRTKPKDKHQIMTDLVKGKIDILVATPVVEVGIDIPTATIILIEGSDRFGLAQLHQLRGRVGRSHRQSYCLLFTSTPNQLQNHRLKILTSTHNGLKLAEIDLKYRGPGHLYGTSQHGFLNLKLASLTNSKLLTSTKAAAEDILASDPSLENHPQLKSKLTFSLAKPIAPN